MIDNCCPVSGIGHLGFDNRSPERTIFQRCRDQQQDHEERTYRAEWTEADPLGPGTQGNAFSDRALCEAFLHSPSHMFARSFEPLRK